MRKQYDFSQAQRSPYAKQQKKQVTIRLDEQTLEYFRRMSEETGIGYQTLINLYLRECAAANKRLSINWNAESAAKPALTKPVDHRQGH